MEGTLGATKRRILERLRQSPADVGEIARELGISRVAIQRHLRDLEALSLVRYEEKRNGSRGRPKRLWRSVDAEGPYARMCGSLIEVVKRNLGSEMLVGLLVDDQCRRLREGLDGLGGVGRERLDALVRYLKAQGYAARVVEEDGTLFIEQLTCPRLGLSSQHQELCVAEERALETILGLPVRLVERISNGGRRCRFEIGAKT